MHIRQYSTRVNVTTPCFNNHSNKLHPNNPKGENTFMPAIGCLTAPFRSNVSTTTARQKRDDLKCEPNKRIKGKKDYMSTKI